MRCCPWVVVGFVPENQSCFALYPHRVFINFTNWCVTGDKQMFKRNSLDTGTGINERILSWGVQVSQSLRGNDVRGFSTALRAQGAAYFPKPWEVQKRTDSLLHLRVNNLII